MNARCAELYTDSVKQIVKSGHDIGGHNYTQDALLNYMEPEQERATIKKCIDILEETSGKRPTGWLSAVIAFTQHKVDFVAEQKLKWHADVIPGARAAARALTQQALLDLGVEGRV